MIQKLKSIYAEIWHRARPYYQQGREQDLAHIEWLMEVAAQVSHDERLDDSLLLPLVILHDVGYARVQSENPFQLNSRKAHMKYGAEIGLEILNDLQYAPEKLRQIVYYVSIHDEWAFGNDTPYRADIILGVFNDLDFSWMATKVGFAALQKILGRTPAETFDFVASNEKIEKRPFCTQSTRTLFHKHIFQRKTEIVF